VNEDEIKGCLQGRVVDLSFRSLRKTEIEAFSVVGETEKVNQDLGKGVTIEFK